MSLCSHRSALAAVFHECLKRLFGREVALYVHGGARLDALTKCNDRTSLSFLDFLDILPPAVVNFRSFSKVLQRLEEDYQLDVVVLVSSFWNGPEEAAAWISVKKSLAAAGEGVRKTAYVYLPFYMRRAVWRPIDTAARVMWSAFHLPTVAKSVDLVIATCVEEVSELRKFAPPGKILESKSLVDPQLAEAMDQTPAKLGDVVTYVGPVEEEKNVRGLLKLAEVLRDVTLVVVGDGDAAERLEDSPIVFKRGVELAELAELMKSTLAGVDLSYYEPAGLRTLEFLYGGVPVAASPNSRSSCHVSDGVDGIRLRNPDDVVTVARWVKTLRERREVREEMGKKAREKAKSLSAVNLARVIVEKLT